MVYGTASTASLPVAWRKSDSNTATRPTRIAACKRFRINLTDFGPRMDPLCPVRAGRDDNATLRNLVGKRYARRDHEHVGKDGRDPALQGEGVMCRLRLSRARMHSCGPIAMRTVCLLCCLQRSSTHSQQVVRFA